MINSIINGKELDKNGVLVDIQDIQGIALNTVRMFDERLDFYVAELLEKLDDWKKTVIEIRLDAILSIKENLENEEIANELIKSICIEIGKPYAEAETEISESIALIDYFLDNVTNKTFLSKVDIDPYYVTKNNFIKLSPLGIVGIIKPWNYPITNSLWSIIPALLAGNIVIYKPSEHCCNTARLLADVFLKSRFPQGVFNVIFGDEKAGQRITECKQVAMISFTGSSETAVKIQKLALDFGIIRKYSIESGGSDFAIVDKKVNLDFAANGIIWGAFNNSGQVCTSIENVLVPVEIYSDFIEILKNKASVLKAERDFGKIQNAELKNKITDYLHTVKSDRSIKIITGGEIHDDYLIPTIIACSNYKNSHIELFSNILRIFSYSDETQLHKIINSSDYGLGCTIWTNEPESERIKNLIDEINVGMVWVNDINIAFPEMPWGGVKNSGVGFNLSLDSLKEFSSLKSISIDTNASAQKEWWYPYED